MWWLVTGLWFKEEILELILDMKNYLNLATQEVFQGKSYSETLDGFNKVAVT